MTYDPVDPDDDAVVESDVDNTSVTTDTINGTSKPFNLLRQAGYSSGDIVPVMPINTMRTNAQSFSSTSFTQLRSVADFRFRHDRFPVQPTHVAISFLITQGSGETTTVRIRNLDDSETVISRTAGSAGGSFVLQSTFDTYSPTTPSFNNLYVCEAKTDTGTNSSSITSFTTFWGIQL